MQNSLNINLTNLLAFKDMLKEIDQNENNIIIVPDKFSLSAEQLYFEEKNLLANFSTRIFSLTKLASSVLKTQLIDKKIIDKDISLMIISSIIQENLSNFKFFKNIKDLNKISSDIFNIISQILSSNVLEFNENLTGTLQDKFSDLNLILKEYLKRRENYLVDASFKYELFLNEIKNSELIKNHNFYFGMFNSLTTQVKDIIKEISKFAKSVHFSASFSENRVNNNEILEFYKSISKNFKENKKTHVLDEKNKFIIQNFFSSNKRTFNLKGDSIKIFEAKNIDDEVLNITNEIKKDIFLNGYRYKDIAICLTNDSYNDKLKQCLTKSKITYFFDEALALSQTSYARFLIDCLNIIADFNIFKLISLVKNYYVKIDEKTKNNFERFIKKFSIKNITQKSNFSIFKDDEFYEDFKTVYNFVVEKIFEFKNKVNSLTIEDFFYNFNEFLLQIGATEKLKEKIEKFKQTDVKKYKQYSQIEEKINNCFENIKNFYNEEIKTEKILHFVKLCFDNININLASTSADCVFIGDALNSYFKNYKKLYILGCDFSSFPSLKKNINLFSDEELTSLEKNNKISPKLADTNKLNFYKCFEVLFSGENLVLSYSLTDGGGNKNFPSNIIKNFIKRFKVFGEELKTLKVNNDVLNMFDENEILNLISLKFNNKNEILKDFYALEDSKYKNVLQTVLKEKFNEDLKQKNEDIIDKTLVDIKHYSASSLEDYFACKNKYFYKNIAKLTKFEPIKLDARIFGNIVHLACFEFAKVLLSQQVLTDNLKEDIVNKVFAKEEFKYLRTIENSKQILENLKNEVLKLFDFIIKQQASSKFKIKYAEFKFVEVFDGITFKGFVDRIDEFNDEFIIIDYKTGITKIDYAEIVLNKKIQLLLYAKILEKKFNKKCKGVYYLSVSDDYSKQNKQKIYLNGITINENNMLHNLDENEIDLKSNYFEFKEKYNLTTEKFEKLTNFVFNNIKNAVLDIKNANFKSDPINFDDFSACDFCEYQEICMKKTDRIITLDENFEKELFDD